MITADSLKRSPSDFRLLREVVSDRATDAGIGTPNLRLVLRSLSVERVLELYRLEGPAFKTEMVQEVRKVTGEIAVGPLFEAE